ncbi:transposase [Candidatus Micrarchaeota archaeon]|nr:transposase [Candidatus Micrarchaeota archaeon]
METRQLRGLEIAKQKQVKPTKEGWFVKSQSAKGFWHVKEDFTCNCPDFEFHRVTCKHAFAVRYYLKAEMQTPTGIVVKEKRLTYSQAWKSYTAAQNAEVRLFDQLLKDLVQEVEEPAYTFGRPRIPFRELIFCCIQKVYSQLSSRRAHSLYGNASERKQIEKAPNYNSINIALNQEDLTQVLQHLITVSAAPLRAVEGSFSVDSTGFTTAQYGEYITEKYGLTREKEWVKLHACIGTKTNIVTSVEISKEEGVGAGDSPHLPVLVQATANGGFTLKEVSADKAYSGRDNIDAIHAVGAMPYIPFKSDATGKARGSLFWSKMFHYFQFNQTEFMEHYHRRPNIEATFSAIKRKLGERLKSKNDVARVNELLCKIVAYNLTVVIHEMHELGIKPDFSLKMDAKS